MKTREIKLLLLSVLMIATGICLARPVSVQLREGRYMEEMKGDLDKAMEIYAKIAFDAEADRRYVAEAIFRLGMCHLKKNENEKAIEQFKIILDKYSDQTWIVQSTQKELEKLAPQSEAAVDEAVKTVSTCTESDPRLAKAMESLKIHPSGNVVKSLLRHLDSDIPTIRRAAIYILWKGSFDDISQAKDKLLELCRHESEYTRGMSALALGQNKVAGSLGVLEDMTVNDSSHYARRCAAYALGLLGDKNAEETLKKALKDDNDFVSQNAMAALTMLEIQIPAVSQDHSVGFPEFEGARIVTKVHIDMSKPDDQWYTRKPEKSFIFYEHNILSFNWKPDKNASEDIDTFAIGVFKDGFDAGDLNNAHWLAVDIPFTASESRYGKNWPAGYELIGKLNRTPKQLTEGSYTVYVFGFSRISGDSTDDWAFNLKNRLTAVGMISLEVKSLPYTQIVNDVINKEGLIFSQNIIQEINSSDSDITTKRFINSDFVKVTGMYDQDGKPMKFTSKHEGNIYRYHVTLNKPVKPGEPIMYINKSKKAGLVNKLSSNPDTFEYRMNHTPGTSVPTRRIEIFKLPQGAKLLSVYPNKAITRQVDGKTEIFIEKTIPPGGSILVNFTYTMDGDRQTDSAGPSLEDRKQAQKLAVEAWKLWGQGQNENAEKLFLKSIENDGSVANTWNGLGWSQFNQGKTIAAEESFLKCLSMDPKHPAALNGMGWISKTSGKTDKAIDYWNKAVRAEPGATAALNGLATTYMEQGEYKKAEAIYKKWLTLDPDNDNVKDGLQKAQAGTLGI